MSRALITGATGFTGPYLITELRSAGYEVFGIARQSRAESDGDIFPCDLCDAQAVSDIVARVRPDVVVHLGAISFVSHEDVDAIYRINIVGTRNLLDAISRCDSGPRAVLLASSANIYGNASVELIDESLAPMPANDYAVSKLAMEFMARLWFDRLPITIARPFAYTGVGQDERFLVPKIVHHFKRHASVIELGNIDVVRDYSDVRSIVRSYRLLLEARATTGNVFNVCSGIGYSLLEILAMMRELSGYAPEVRVNPKYVRSNEVRKLVGSRAKLANAVGPLTDIPLRETLRWMYEE